MSDHTINLDRLFDLVGTICDEDASLAEFVELDSIVLTDQAACRRYLAYCRMHSALRSELRAHRATQAVCRRIDVKPTAAKSSEFDIAIKAEAPNAPASIFLSTTIHGPLGYYSDWPVAYLIATVICGIGALVGAYTYVSQPVQIVRESPAAAKDYVVAEPNKEFVGRITGMVDCRWADPAMASVSGNVAMGQKLALATGLMEITYNTGAKVILQGPVTYEIESKNGGFLLVGKLTGKVEVEKAKGFVVRTPTATVTDLGTEFGVEVNRDGEVVTHVFVGEVRLTAGEGQEGTGQEQVIRAGRTARIAANSPITTVNNASADGAKRFVRAMPPIERISTSDAYGQVVLSMQPDLYYRLDWPKNDRERLVVLDSATGGHHGELHLPDEYKYSQPPYKRGRFGDSSFALFKPPVVGYILVPDYPKTTNGQLTVSAWVLAESRPASATIASSRTLKADQFHFGLHDMDGDLAVVLRGGDGSTVALREGVAKPLPLHQWQHVAFVADGSTVRLYRNGVEVASRACAGISRQSDVRHLAIGCTAERSMLCKPTVITGSAPYEPDLSVENLIDGAVTAADIGTMNNLGDGITYPDYACLNRTPAFVSMDFGSALTLNTLVYSQRPNSPSTDNVSQIDLWFSDSPFLLSDPGRTADETLNITETSPKLTKYDLGSAHTARYVLAQLHLKEGVDGFAGGSELLLGSTVAAQGKMLPYRYWHGRLDEIAVFNHALTAEQVRQLFAGDNLTHQESMPRTGLLEQNSRDYFDRNQVPGKEVKE